MSPSNKRNSFCVGDFVLEKVVDFNSLKNFYCGLDDLDKYFLEDAKIHKQELLAETYQLTSKKYPGTIIALVSLCNDSVRWEDLPSGHYALNLGDAKRYESYPAVKIARLGVVKALQGNNIGTNLINIIKNLFLTDNRTGCRIITVDAHNSGEVKAFYQKNEFDFLDDENSGSASVLMWFDLKTLSAG